MTEPSTSTAPQTRLYLVSPDLTAPTDAMERLPDLVAQCLAAGDVACLRLRLADGVGAKDLRPTVRAIAECAQRRDVAVLVEDAWRLAAEEGLDGVHLSDLTRDFAAARDAVGEDGVLGAAAGATRHNGLIAGERGADYVAFHPVGGDPTLIAGPVAEADLFAWWQDMIELPVVAEGGLDPATAAALAPLVDFLALGPEIWGHAGGPAAAVRSYQSVISG